MADRLEHHDDPAAARIAGPARRRTMSLLFAGTGGAAAVVAWRMAPLIGAPWLALLWCYAITAFLLGCGTAILRHRESLASKALSRGEDLIGRWRIEAADWQDFMALEAQLRSDPGSRPNEMRVPTAVPPEGIGITIGREAIDIGGSIHLLPLRGTPEIQQATLNESRVRPSFIEIQLKYPGGGAGASGVPRGPSYSLLRFPVARHALREARRVTAHFNADGPGTPDAFHGTGDGTNPEDLSVCWNCGFQTHKFRSECPRCGSSLQSRRWSRRYGLVIAVLGAAITTVLALVLSDLWAPLRHPGVSVHGTRFSGSAGAAATVLAVLVSVLATGGVMLGYGLFQVLTGRRSRVVVRVLVAIAAGAVLAAQFLPDP